MLFWSLWFYLIGILMKINYVAPEAPNLYVYLVGSGVLFVGSLISETAAISIMSKVISPTLSMSLLNAGFISGMADTMGRSSGNILIAVFGIFGVRWLPTTLYGFYAVVIIVFIILTWINYDELQKLVYVQLLTTENEKMLKEKKKQRLLKRVEDARTKQPEFSLTRHANEVIENREVHLQEIMNQSKVLGESTIGVDGTEDAPQ